MTTRARLDVISGVGRCGLNMLCVVSCQVGAGAISRVWEAEDAKRCMSHIGEGIEQTAEEYDAWRHRPGRRAPKKR